MSRKDDEDYDDHSYIENKNCLLPVEQKLYEQVRFCGLDQYNMEQLDELVERLILRSEDPRFPSST